MNQKARELLMFLHGRALLFEEVNRCFPNIPDTELEQMLHGLARTGKIQLHFGVEREDDNGGIFRKGLQRFGMNPAGYRCRRCGERERILPFECTRCQGRCYYCDRCVHMGRSMTCGLYVYGEPVVGDANPLTSPVRFPSRLTWQGTLTPAQEAAAGQAVNWLLDRSLHSHANMLLWAVCGGGKTEVIYPPIDEVLRRGGNVLVATPRKDVVKELLPRMQNAFSLARVLGVYGGGSDKWREGEITVATTHQVLRFYKRFEFVILDEMDAFPYHHDRMLHDAVKRAVKPLGKTLFLTATPPRSLLHDVKKRRIETARIPVRYHGYPLPVPKVIRESHLRRRFEEGKRIETLERFVRNGSQRQRQAFIFVPSVRQVSVVLSYLQRRYPEWANRMAGVHAKDAAREDKVAGMRDGQYRILVTTTIMERGVTIPRCDVLVLWADAQIFDEAALVQMAGRSGRSAEASDGSVVFLSEAVSRAQRRAVRQIVMMNREAYRKGYTRDRLT